MTEEVLDLKRAAEYLQLSPTFIYKCVKTGAIPAFRVGRVWRFKKEVLDEWMRAQTEQHTSSMTKKSSK